MINLISRHAKLKMYQAKYMYLVARRLKILILYICMYTGILDHDVRFIKPYSLCTTRRQITLLLCHISRTLAMKSATVATTQ